LLQGLGPLGKLIILAAPPTPVELHPAMMIHYGNSITAWPSGHAQDTEEAIKFAEDQGIECMIEKFEFEKANEALDHMVSGKVRFRGVLIP
jgi:D-arabinose 1-dehydrogenase-like Zn-dependent alcohol dehydrogenase